MYLLTVITVVFLLVFLNIPRCLRVTFLSTVSLYLSSNVKTSFFLFLYPKFRGVSIIVTLFVCREENSDHSNSFLILIKKIKTLRLFI